MAVATIALVALAARYLSPRRAARPAMACAAALLVFAAVGARVPGSGRGDEVLLVDVSWSTGADRPDVSDLARRAGLDPGRARIALFGAVPIELPLGAMPGDEDLRRAGAGASDLAAALRAAARSAGPGSRIVVATDGRVGGEDVAAEAARLLDSGVALSLVPFGVARTEDPRVIDLSMAGRAPEGAVLPIGVTVGGAPGTELHLRVEMDGRVEAERAVRISSSGRTSVRFEVAPAAGWHVVSAALRGAPGTAENDRLASGVVVSGPPRALVVNDAGLGQVLAGRGYGVSSGTLDLPLAGYDVVLLRDTPAIAMRDGGAAVREFVRGGGGLLVVGGALSFGPGGYAGRPLEECLPLRSNPGREGILAVVLLDRSGTMGERFAEGGDVKLSAARGAAARLLAALPDEATFGFVPFTAEPLPRFEPVLLGRTDGRERAAAMVAAAAEARGGTALAPPLLLAAGEAAKFEGRRLVLLVSDGRLEEEAPEPVLAAAAAVRRAGARLTVLAVGRDADEEFLGLLAGSADEVVRVDGRGGLEQAFLDALLAVEGEGRVLLGPRAVRRGPGRGPEVPGGLPDVSGLVRTWPQGAPEVLYVTGGDVPLVALGRFGLGRVAAVATDPGGGWAPLPAWGELIGLLADEARRPAALGGPRAEARLRDGGVEIVAHLPVARAEVKGVLSTSGGRSLPVVLRARGDGACSGLLPVVEPGAARLTIEAGESTFDGGISIPGPAEFLASGPDETALERLREVFGRPVAPGAPFRDVSAVFAVLGLLLLLVDRLLALKPPAVARR